MRLALVRHGQTASNVGRVMDTLPPGGPLDRTGRRQAERLAERLAGEPVPAVYASTAIRAQQTAAPVAARHGLTVTVLNELREIYLGDLEGTSGDGPHAEYNEIFEKWAGGDLRLGLRGGETADELLGRFLAVVAQIKARHSSGLVLVVSHGGAIRLAAMRLADNLTPQVAIDGMLPNTGWVLLEATPADAGGPGWHCLEWTGADLDPRRAARVLQ